MAEEKPAVTEEKPAVKEKPSAENVVFIGIKPVMNYVLAVITQFNMGTGDVILKARGQAISRAVDVAEILRHQFVHDANVDDIEISTEKLTSDEGRESNVSSIEIFLSLGEDEVGRPTESLDDD